jgi:predicted nucleic acid-binding protein
VAFSVVLDTCVLYPAHLRDTMLRLAERDFYRPLWSADILGELQRNLIEEAHINRQAVQWLIEQMQGAFPDAEVTGYEPLVGVMTCDAKDRHVLAVAVRADAAAIVTHNTTDFPTESVKPYEIDVIHPDEFLLDQLDLAPRLLIETLEAQAAANKREPQTLPSLLDALTTAGAPAFADEVRRRR